MPRLGKRGKVGVAGVVLAGLMAVAGMAAQQGAVSGGGGAAAAQVPMCAMDQLSLALDAENGNFDGMSHSGTLVVLRNLGGSACRVEAVPVITLRSGATGEAVRGVMAGARSMHPGPVLRPVLRPVVVAAGAEVTASLRWVSGEVFDDSVCVVPKTLAVTIGGATQEVEFGNKLCGQRGKGIEFEMTRWAVDPVWTGQ